MAGGVVTPPLPVIGFSGVMGVMEDGLPGVAPVDGGRGGLPAELGRAGAAAGAASGLLPAGEPAGRGDGCMELEVALLASSPWPEPRRPLVSALWRVVAVLVAELVGLLADVALSLLAARNEAPDLRLPVVADEVPAP